MNEIRTFKGKNIDVGLEDYSRVSVEVVMDPTTDRMKQHLIEEKMDRFFDEVEMILLNAEDHTV